MTNQKALGTGLGIFAVLSVMMLSMLAFSNVAGAAPITADELLRTGGTGSATIGQVAGLGTQNLQVVIGQVIRAILGFLGVVAVVIILMGGFKWMTSGGADQKIAEARKFIIMGLVGLAIVLSAYAIASFVITALVGAVSTPTL